MATTRPIIIVKKKAGHGGHHGGAWKVAYADFVTAMMALFIVLWLMNSSKQIKEAVGGYFKDPSGTSKNVGTDQQGAADNFNVSKNNMAQLKEQLQKSVRRMSDFDKLKDQIEMTVTAEGLRIELMESASGTFFESGSPKPNKDCKELLALLAKTLGTLPNKLSIEGHTDSKPFAGNPNYSNWELSTDRANTARRLMQENGVRSDQVAQVRGYADQRLRTPSDPTNPENRRISVIIQYVEVAPGSDKTADASGKAAASGDNTPAPSPGQDSAQQDSGKKD